MNEAKNSLEAFTATSTMSANDLRVSLSNEWHARPRLSLPSPLRCSHLLCMRSQGSLRETRERFASFCRAQGQSAPGENSRHHSVHVGNCLLKWEGHTEADSYTILVTGNAAPPFSTPALDFLEATLREQLLGELFLGVQVEVIDGAELPPEERLQRIRSLLGTSEVYGGSISNAQGEIWSSFRLDAQGFVRLIMIDDGLGEQRVSRYLQRMLEIEAYRMLAMLALPMARKVMNILGKLEPELDAVTAQIAERDTQSAQEVAEEREQEQLLKRITSVAAKVEHLVAVNAYRFAAARAYAGIVNRRLTELQETSRESAPRYTAFLQKSLLPAMGTCDAAEQRTQQLAQRVSRATQLLNSMVDLDQKKQNQKILEGMAERANLQLRLQQSVEGFSIFAITYYAVGLLGYLFKSGKEAGLGLDPDLLTGITAPIVLAVVWLSVRRVKRRLQK